MCGTVADLINSPQEYELAIEMCLGAMLQNIVTDTDEDSKRLINYLFHIKIINAHFLF